MRPSSARLAEDFFGSVERVPAVAQSIEEVVGERHGVRLS
jgi:hypothetical protein